MTSSSPADENIRKEFLQGDQRNNSFARISLKIYYSAENRIITELKQYPANQASLKNQ